MKPTIDKFVNCVLYLFVSTVMFSCVTAKQAKQLIYLNDVSDSINHSVVINSRIILQPGDRLNITVSSLNQASVVPYNLTGATTSYLVEDDGTILFPQLGKMHVSGFTLPRLVDSLTSVLMKFVMDPVVVAQVLNFKITVLGDVSSPGTKTVPEGKITLLEAIGLSGDLTFFGRRDNILIVREKEGKREFGRVDLTSANLFNSPYYNLKQNDIIYVEPNKAKIQTSDQTFSRNLSLATSVLSLLATLIFLIINVTN